MVVDVDFHQGDGTALCFACDPLAFLLFHSLPGGLREQQSTLDIGIMESENNYLTVLQTVLIAH